MAFLNTYYDVISCNTFYAISEISNKICKIKMVNIHQFYEVFHEAQIILNPIVKCNVTMVYVVA